VACLLDKSRDGAGITQRADGQQPGVAGQQARRSLDDEGCLEEG
jgi:hypothetical protein